MAPTAAINFQRDSVHFPDFDCFYTNPPWGASNEGESVKVFVQRGMEATKYTGEGAVVIADDTEKEWAPRVLANVQAFALSSGFFIQRMMSRVHSYHLDDAPELRSCNLILRAVPGNVPRGRSIQITDPARLQNFYGFDSPPAYRYVREKLRLEYGKAHDDEYSFEPWEMK